ncbi:MAG: hypothetical protein HY901_08020, partial [Deltaproteobacteria bacterium]|nr:hypothetical protein [Deltaproteobacteria bacterium]
PKCNPTAGLCVECLDESDCTATAPICDSSTMACRVCQASDCTGAKAICETEGANAGNCVECTSSDSSACEAPTPYCDLASERCVECRDASDCSAGTPICDATDHVCRPCEVAADCAPNGVCAANLSDPQVGRCVQCTSEAGGCTAPLTCDPMTDTCLGCTSSAQCSDPNPICGDDQSCQPCSTSADCEGELCATSGPAQGACVPCTPDDATRCAAETPRCDPATDTCVACLAAGDCNDPLHPACDVTEHKCVSCGADLGSGQALPCADPTKPACQQSGPLAGQCTECSASNNAACSTARPICLATGRCGCGIDSDCGLVGSGRVCASGTCQDGCRGTGNECPENQACTSTDEQVGTCQPAPGLDAGAPADAAETTVDASGADLDGSEPVLASDAGAAYVLEGGGCSCNATGGPLVLLGALASLAMVRRRRRG